MPWKGLNRYLSFGLPDGGRACPVPRHFLNPINRDKRVHKVVFYASRTNGIGIFSAFLEYYRRDIVDMLLISAEVTSILLKGRIR